MNQAYERKTQINVNYKGYILQQSSIYEGQNFYQHNLYKKKLSQNYCRIVEKAYLCTRNRDRLCSIDIYF